MRPSPLRKCVNIHSRTFNEAEEGEEYEYAAWYSGSGAKDSIGHVEEGVLLQPLEEATASESGQIVAGLARLCESELHSDTSVSRNGACARFVDLCRSSFGGCGRFVKQSRHSNFRCEVYFAGHCSTAAQVYARYKAQVAYQQNVVGRLQEAGSRVWEAVKYAKPPPP
jgi:hypothetical protein